MRCAVTSGCTFFNGGEFYGPPTHNSLTLLRTYYETYLEDASKIVLNVKGATKPGLHPDGSPAFVRQSVENCLAQMGPHGKIDMFECARVDPNVPIEETLGELAKLVSEGKIGGVALSEVSAATIRRAAKVAKIVAVETELSLWSTDPLTNGIAEACAELDIPIIAYSPVGRGMLTGQIKSFDDLLEKDVRKILPRYQPGNFEKNLELVRLLEGIARRRGCTSAQLALGWLVGLGKRERMPVIIPIPGSTDVARIKENAAAVEFSEQEMKEVDEILASFEVAGDRYHEFGMKLVDG